MIAFGINNGHFAGRIAEQNVWPVTYLMLQSVEGSAILFLYIVATLYAAELLWRERDTHFNGIHDALPMRESTDWLSRFTAIVVIELILLTVAMLTGIVMQTIAGYYHYEFLQYFKELYIVTFPQILMFALLALFIQTVVSNKFVGHGIVIGIFVLMPILFSFGWENTLYLIGQIPAYHLLRHERLWPFRARAVLVHRLLALDRRGPGRDLGGSGAARSRGFPRRARAASSAARPAVGAAGPAFRW